MVEVAQPTSVDNADIARFDAIAARWWDAKGPFRPLHELNPTRLTYIRDTLCDHFNRDGRTKNPLDGLRILDIGCGGGLLCEPMARLGADVTGVDASSEAIRAASTHAEAVGLSITYRNDQAETLVEEGATFDVIINMEVIEHVADVELFLKTCRTLLNDDGIMAVSTLNRTARSYAMAIVGAEYILGWLPRGTHNWRQFITPDEMRTHLVAAGFQATDFAGMTLNPIGKGWQLSGDTSVNYLGTALPQ
ncbi:MAG: bifunctional 2-polyprenyl-6-hydroxyphenol methylase/3-demethylubiquinol 3-O-methyltransferase UbiG [Pseudomonadota bacterium]